MQLHTVANIKIMAGVGGAAGRCNDVCQMENDIAKRVEPRVAQTILWCKMSMTFKLFYLYFYLAEWNFTLGIVLLFKLKSNKAYVYIL